MSAEWTNITPPPVPGTGSYGFAGLSLDATNPDVVMVSTLYLIGQPNDGAVGVYRSDDGAATWIRINDDQHQYGGIGGEPITGDPRIFGSVYFGTNGRGIIYGDLPPSPRNAWKDLGYYQLRQR